MHILTSNGSEARYNTWTGRWSGALTALTFSLIHAGGGLHCDLMLKIYTRKTDSFISIILFILYLVTDLPKRKSDSERRTHFRIAL